MCTSGNHFVLRANLSKWTTDYRNNRPRVSLVVSSILHQTLGKGQGVHKAVWTLNAAYNIFQLYVDAIRISKILISLKVLFF